MSFECPQGFVAMRQFLELGSVDGEDLLTSGFKVWFRF